MKRGDYLSYEFFEQIEHDSALARFLNGVFHKLHLARTFSAPTLFNEPDIMKDKKEQGKHKIDKAVRFYETCTFEVYAHAIIPRLIRWQDKAFEYLNDYNGSWEFYARSKRLRLIDEYGGEDSDYNKDGSIKTDVGESELLEYSIIHDLIQDDWKDIFTQTKPDDLRTIMTWIQIDGDFSVRDMLRVMGAEDLKSYRTENGEMVENSKDDEALHKVESQQESEDISAMLYSVAYIIHRIVRQMQDLPKNEDNKEYFDTLHYRINNLLDMELFYELSAIHKEIKTGKGGSQCLQAETSL